MLLCSKTRPRRGDKPRGGGASHCFGGRLAYGSRQDDVAAGGDNVSNRVAIGLGLGLLLAVGADLGLNHGAGVVFLLRKFADFVDYLTFWR